MPSRRLRFVLALLIVPVSAALFVQPASAQWPPEIKNLKHLPEDTDFRELMGVMRGFAMGLGVRCQHCHIGEEGQPLATFDFASDEKETKRKARTMLAMVDAINGDHVAKVVAEGESALEVKCVTCHRGLARPEQLEDILVRVASSEGPEAAVAKYRELREVNYGNGSYNFSEATLIRAAEAAAASDPNSAVALLNESLVHAPESSWALAVLAEVEVRRGNKDGAVAALERILEFEPDNARVKQRLEQITAPPPLESEGGEGS